MAYSKSYRTPVQLTGVARGAFRAIVEQFVTSGLLPAQANFTLDFSFATGQAALPPAASFRSWNTESMVNTTDRGSVASGKLPPISIRMHVDEYMQLTMYRNNEAIGVKFEEYAIRNAQAIANRIVLAQAQAIETGKVTIAERGLSFEVNFQRNAGLTANAGTAWSTTATSTPLTDLETLRAVFGKSVDRIILSRQAMTYLQANADLIKISVGRGSDLPSRISVADVQSVFADFGFGRLEVNEQKVVNASGSEVALFSADKVILINGSTVGSTELGVTAEAIDSENGISAAQQPGLFAGAAPQDDPKGFNVFTSAVALPVLSSPNNTAVLDAY